MVAVDRPGVSWRRADAMPPPMLMAEADLERGRCRGQAGVGSPSGRSRPPGLVRRPEDYLTSRENLRSLAATNVLVAAALDAGCRRIVGRGNLPRVRPLGAPPREADPTSPSELYSTCKHAARLVSERLAAAAGASFAWARVFHLHGPGEDRPPAGPDGGRQASPGKPIELTPGDQVRDYLRVEDVADAVAHLAISEATGTVNVCSGVPVRLRDLLLSVAGVVGRPDLLRFGAIPCRTGERMCIVGVPGTLRSLGWSPRHPTRVEALRYLAT